jgi:hypothetical protein
VSIKKLPPYTSYTTYLEHLATMEHVSPTLCCSWRIAAKVQEYWSPIKKTSRTNHLDHYTLEKLILTISVLILDECEHYMQDLMVTVHTDCCKYLPFTFFLLEICCQCKGLEDRIGMPSSKHQDKKTLYEEC